MRVQVAISVAGAALAGCAYQAGTLSAAEPGRSLTIGCLDLAVDRRTDLPDGVVVVAYAFGNRCDHPAVVDLSAVTVIGRAEDGERVVLAAYDPDLELEPLRVDGRSTGREAIAYSPPDGTELADVCVDAASIAGTTPAAWLCFPTQVQIAGVP
jgi:hypothetical protein